LKNKGSLGPANAPAHALRENIDFSWGFPAEKLGHSRLRVEDARKAVS